MPRSRAVVYSADGCHLCEPAIEVVRRVFGEDVEVVDITADQELERRYRETIPVIFVDGAMRFCFEVDEAELRALA